MLGCNSSICLENNNYREGYNEALQMLQNNMQIFFTFKESGKNQAYVEGHTQKNHGEDKHVV